MITPEIIPVSDRRRMLYSIQWLRSDRRWIALVAVALVLAPLVWARQEPQAQRGDSEQARDSITRAFAFLAKHLKP